MGALLGKLFAKALIAGKTIIAKLAAKIILLMTVISETVGGLIGGGADDVVLTTLNRLTHLLIQAFFKTEEAQSASMAMTYVLWETLQWGSIAIYLTGTISVLCLLIICIPLVKRLLFKKRPYIFLSFQHMRESLAVAVENALGREGFLVYRLPYQQEATHQNVVTEVNKAIRRCDAVVCLPGSTESYVEIEVGAATHGFKPIAFAVPSQGGTLPNSADKRYPVFRLEAIEAELYKPLAAFLHYVVADLTSGLQQVWESARHPFVVIAGWSVLIVLLVMLLTLFLVLYFQAFSATEVLVAKGGAFAEVRAVTVLTTVGLLTALAAVVATVAGYTILVVAGVWRQRRAQRRASLKAGIAEFARDDWLGVIPGMQPGSKLYECLFDIVPLAHHEAHRLTT